MDDARRAVSRWLLAALLGYGQGQASHHWEVARLERPVTPDEARDFLGAYSKVRFLHSSRLASHRMPSR